MKSKPTLKSILIAIVITFTTNAAQGALNPANFTEDLDQLLVNGNNLISTMTSVTLTPLTMASQLSGLETSVQTYLDSVGSVYRTVSSSTDNTVMSLAPEMLVSLQTLATISSSLSQALGALGSQMAILAPSTALTTLDTSLASMLRLSDDIGVMADRILEMSDQILIMADNIGLMADRILATQVIQGDNLKVIVDASLETQKNILMLFSMFF